MNIDTAQLRQAVESKYREDMDAIDRFEQLVGRDLEVAPPALSAPNQIVVTKTYVMRKTGPGKPKPEAESHKPKPGTHSRRRAGGVKHIGHCLWLPAPFGAEELAAASGMTMKAAGTALWRWTTKGYLERAGGRPGRYYRTKAFPVPVEAASAPAPASAATAAPAGRIKIPGLDDKPKSSLDDTQSVEDLKTILETARRDLKDSEANGRVRLAQILKDKVAKLEHQIQMALA